MRAHCFQTHPPGQGCGSPEAPGSGDGWWRRSRGRCASWWSCWGCWPRGSPGWRPGTRPPGLSSPAEPLWRPPGFTAAVHPPPATSERKWVVKIFCFVMLEMEYRYFFFLHDLLRHHSEHSLRRSASLGGNQPRGWWSDAGRCRIRTLEYFIAVWYATNEPSHPEHTYCKIIYRIQSLTRLNFT